jgi:hypothetical protein
VPDPISDEEYLTDDLIGQANTDSGEPSRPPAH